MVIPEAENTHKGLQSGDLVLKFGHLDHASFPTSSLQPLANLVSQKENVIHAYNSRMSSHKHLLVRMQDHIVIQVLRDDQIVFFDSYATKGMGRAWLAWVSALHHKPLLSTDGPAATSYLILNGMPAIH